MLTLADATLLLSEVVVLEENVAGANLGISVGPDGEVRAQNRGQYLLHPFSGQFGRLGQWLRLQQDALLMRWERS